MRQREKQLGDPQFCKLGKLRLYGQGRTSSRLFSLLHGRGAARSSRPPAEHDLRCQSVAPARCPDQSPPETRESTPLGNKPDSTAQTRGYLPRQISGPGLDTGKSRIIAICDLWISDLTCPDLEPDQNSQ